MKNRQVNFTRSCTPGHAGKATHHFCAAASCVGNDPRYLWRSRTARRSAECRHHRLRPELISAHFVMHARDGPVEYRLEGSACSILLNAHIENFFRLWHCAISVCHCVESARCSGTGHDQEYHRECSTREATRSVRGLGGSDLAGSGARTGICGKFALLGGVRPPEGCRRRPAPRRQNRKHHELVAKVDTGCACMCMSACRDCEGWEWVPRTLGFVRARLREVDARFAFGPSVRVPAAAGERERRTRGNQTRRQRPWTDEAPQNPPQEQEVERLRSFSRQALPAASAELNEPRYLVRSKAGAQVCEQWHRAHP